MASAKCGCVWDCGVLFPCKDHKRLVETVDKLRGALGKFVDDDGCFLDEKGRCRTHSAKVTAYNKPCAVREARELLAGESEDDAKERSSLTLEERGEARHLLHKLWGEANGGLYRKEEWNRFQYLVERLAKSDHQSLEKPPWEEANRMAKALGSRGGLKGGRARAQALTKEERSDSARKAAQARWDKHRKNEADLGGTK